MRLFSGFRGPIFILGLLGLASFFVGVPGRAQDGKGKAEAEKKKPKAERVVDDASDEKKEEAKGPYRNLKYRSIGPAIGGRVTSVSGIPGTPGVVYIGAASGGVWKTSDAGRNWKPIFDDQPSSSIGAVAVAPSDANFVYVGSGEADIRGNVAPGNGIYVSKDAGKTWKHVWKQKGQIGRIAVDPGSAQTAFVAVLGSAFGPNKERGVYRTTDGGDTWEQVLAKDENTGAIDVCIDPSNSRVIYAALWQARRTPWNMTSGGPGSGIYRSTDGGDTWKPFPQGENGLPKGPWGRIGLAVAPSDGDRVYALIEAEKGGLYRTDDAGKKWELVNGERYLQIRPWYFSVIAVDPVDSDIVWVGNLNLLRSADGGKRFKKIKGPHHVDHHDVWIDPKDPNRLINANDGGVDITTNNGASWTAHKLPICQFYHVHVDNHVPYRVMGNIQDQGTAAGPSNSLSADGITLRDWITVGGGETGSSVPDPKNPDIIYAGEYMGFLSRYDRKTRQAHAISVYPGTHSGLGAEALKYRFQWTAPLLISPHDSSVLYHAANVLFRSTDQGRSWKPISRDLTTDDKSKQKYSGGPITGDNTGAEYYCTIFALAESPKQAGVLWAGSDDGLVHVTDDGGKSWTNVTANIPGLPKFATIGCIEASPHDAKTAYVVADNHRQDDNRPYVWVTHDLGKTWTSLAAKLPQDDYARVVREDPFKAGRLFLGSETQVWFSRTAGESWETLKLNMPTVGISDLVIKGDDLVVGTSGRSIWILDDVTPIREGANKADKELRLFPAAPAVRWRFDWSHAGEDPLAFENPPTGAALHYFLPAKPKGDVTLEILDEKGRLVRRFDSKKKKPEFEEDDPDAPSAPPKPTVLETKPGLHRVVWDLHWRGPTLIPGAKNDWGTPYEGPLAAPGKYVAKLTVDGKEVRQTFDVKMDPRVKESDDDLAMQHRLVLELHDAISRVSNSTRAIQSVRKQIQARVELLKENKDADAWRKQAKEFVKKLDDLEARFHNPKAKVSYDILADRGGAKLYSRVSALFDMLKSSDGPVTQGMRTESADMLSELGALEKEWAAVRGPGLEALNEAARRFPTILIPPAPKD